MISITWKVDKIECIRSFDDKTNIVNRVYFTLTASENGVSSVYKSSRDLPFNPDTPSFVEYENLTEDIVLGWVFESLTIDQKNELELIVSDSVKKQLEAQVEELPLPWATDDIEVVPAPEPPAADSELDDTVVELGPVFPELNIDPPAENNE